MTLTHRYTLLLALAVCAAVGYRAAFIPPVVQRADGAVYRHLFATQYLAFKGADDSRLEPWLKELYKSLDKPLLAPETAEAIVVLAGIQGNLDIVKKGLAQQPGLKNGPAIAYAFKIEESLPDAWETTLEDDFYGNHLRALIFERKGETNARAEALFSLRINEAAANRDNLGTALLTFLGMLGLGLMVSMSISSRQFRRLGQRFFNLLPLIMSRAMLLRFLALFLLAEIAVDAVSRYLIELGMGSWQADLVGVILEAVVAVYMMKRLVFPKAAVLPILGLENMTMSVGHVFRIFGGVAIIAGCWQFSQNIAVLISWPTDRLPGMELFDPIVKSTLGTPLYLLIGCILSAALQEIIFRGLVFRSMLSMMKPWQAIMLSAAVYALIHPLPAWPMAFAIGFGLALVFYRTASLVVTIWSHALWSCMFLLLAVLDVNI